MIMAVLAGSGGFLLEELAIDVLGYPFRYKPPNLLDMLLHNIGTTLPIVWNVARLPSLLTIIVAYAIFKTKRSWAKMLLIVMLVPLMYSNFALEFFRMMLAGPPPLTPFFVAAFFIDVAYRGKLKSDKSLMRRWLPLQLILLGMVLLAWAVSEGFPMSLVGLPARDGQIIEIGGLGYPGLLVVTVWYGIYCCRKKPSPREEG